MQLEKRMGCVLNRNKLKYLCMLMAFLQLDNDNFCHL